MTPTLDAPAPSADRIAVLAPARHARPHLPDWRLVRADLMAALPGWGVARLIVLAALALAHFVVNNLHVTDRAVRGQLRQGLFAWDAGFYRGIATHGYGFGAVPHEALRFFPLFPLAGRELGVVLGGHPDWALILIANGAALATGALLHRLVLLEKGDAALARRATWLVALVPPAFVLVLGYSEALFMALGVATFLALRTRRWYWAAAFGALAGLARPTGLLLAVPAAVEAWRAVAWSRRSGAFGWHRGERARTLRNLGGPVLSVAGPVAGVGIFCAWAWGRYGDFFLPLHVQQDGRLRGAVVDPLTAVLHEGRGILQGHHVGSGLHVPWAVALMALVVVCFRRWPACYGAFAAVMLLAALSSKNLDSLERYALGAFPLVLVGASLTASAWVERAVLVLGAAALEGYAALAFLNAVVP